ncbi:MAG TPA: hypothetical protein VGS22_28375 [Thermoanaerobaculia bacterium]|jgi:hypothetical protein|nr:hypothetical protein [Thermoanaerobaculia bacterium]
MDMGLLAQAAVLVLGPLLGKLLSAGGDSAAEAVGEKVGEGVFEKAKALWGKLGKKVEAKPGAPEAAKVLAANPEDEDARAMMVLQLKSILAADPALASEVEQLVRQTSAGSVMIATATGGSAIAQGGGVAASGGGIAIGGNVLGGVSKGSGKP